MKTHQDELGQTNVVTRGRAGRGFAGLRAPLALRQIASIRFVYYAFWDTCHVTLCATSVVPDGGHVELAPRLRRRLLRAFLRWMSLVYPEWTDGPDAGGVFDWDLTCDAFTHRHSGFRQQLVRSTIGGEVPDSACRAAPASP